MNKIMKKEKNVIWYSGNQILNRFNNGFSYSLYFHFAKELKMILINA